LVWSSNSIQPRNRADVEKHGVDFGTAQFIWTDPNMLEVPALSVDEPCFLIIGRIGTKHWSAIITYRKERIRLISVKRSRPEEIRHYEGA
jgi:uncharacterized DUF497 family protein